MDVPNYEEFEEDMLLNAFGEVQLEAAAGMLYTYCRVIL